jgi:ABC-type glycerol-3-phosphate transport system substrate-binding protein
VTPLANQTQTSLLTASLYASMDAFVDNVKSKVTFDSPAFYQLLDYAKKYGTVDNSNNDNNNNNDTYVDENTMLQNGELALSSAYIGGPSSYDQYVEMVGGPVSITGYPSADKRGPMCYMSTMLAISSASGSQDASWDFVKSFLSEDAQKKVVENYGIPVLTSAFEGQINSAMNPDVNNNNGNIAYDKMGQVAKMTAETAQAYRDLVNGLNTLASYDQEIVNIVLEEVPEFFDGQKTDKEVSSIIQNRVQTLVNERQ